ncbi:MAG TPA: polysaccharide biosynthesis/export family protein [bacterium]|nr:polysaccharide biosynthesis/export family protein [bacterium]
MFKHILIALLLACACVPVLQCQTAGDAYRVGADDVLTISILGRMDYKTIEDVTVSSEGKILLQIMQDEVIVDGKTCDEIDQHLTDILKKDYLNDPTVIVEIKEYRSKQVLLIGEVKRPGEVALQKNRVTLKDLLMQAGGPTGDINKTVTLLRTVGDAPEKPTTIGLDQLLITGKYDDLTVEDGDVIYVLSKDKNLPIQDLNQTVYVFGHVQNPGIVPFNENLTVLRAVIEAGNFTKDASPGRTTVKRRDKDGKIKTIDVDLQRVMSSGEKSRDIQLQPGDVVYVPRAIF